MKKFLFIFLSVIIANALFAQQVTKDTTYLERGVNPDSGDTIFYKIRVLTFSNGNQKTDRTEVGDTLTVINALTNESADLSRQIRTHAVEVIQKHEKYVLPILSNQNTLQSAFGFNMLTDLRTRFEQFYLGSWRVRVNGAAPVTGSIAPDQSGVLKFTATGITAKTVVILSEQMARIMAYPTAGKNTDIYIVSGQPIVYSDIEKSLVLIKKP